MARKASCPGCAPLPFSSRTPTATLTGLEPGTAYNISVVGVNKWGQRTPSSNTLLLTTPAGVRLTAAKATGPSSGTATAVGTPPSGFASFVFTLKSATCPTCKPLTFSSKTPNVAFTKLEPATKVRGWRVGGQGAGMTGMGSNGCPTCRLSHVVKPAGVPQIGTNSALRFLLISAVQRHGGWVQQVGHADARQQHAAAHHASPPCPQPEPGERQGHQPRQSHRHRHPAANWLFCSGTQQL